MMHNCICYMFSLSALNIEGYWEVTDVREGAKIYLGYAERFCQTFLAQVGVVFNYDIKDVSAIKVLCG